MGKIGPKFSHLLTVRAKGADPPPSYGQPDRKKTVFFDDFPNCNSQILGGGKASFKESFLAPQTGTWAP